jgi:hypothetical protein
MKNYQVFHDYAAGFAEKHGLLYLDYMIINEETGLFDDADFFDAGHLNGRAVKKANDYFVKWLKEGFDEKID